MKAEEIAAQGIAEKYLAWLKANEYDNTAARYFAFVAGWTLAQSHGLASAREEEREACAKICDDAAARHVASGNIFDAMKRRDDRDEIDYSRMGDTARMRAKSLRDAAAAIRARKDEPKPEQPKP